MPKYLDMHGLETLTGEIENTYLKKNQRGAAGGVASLNSSGKVPSSQLPDTGTSDYSDLTNKPQINGVTLYGNKTSANLGIANAENPVFTGSMSMGRVENTTVGEKSTATGTSVTASGSNSHAEGGGTTASGAQSHAEGGGTTASGSNSHSEGAGSEATNSSAHAEGTRTTASGDSSHSEGSGTTASGYSAHAEGAGTTASGSYSHAEGASTIAASGNAHAEGGGTQANAGCAHAEGSTTRANGSNSHSEGGGTIANGDCAHAEGSTTQANGASSHAEGGGTVANGACSHVGGRCNVPDDYSSWAEWVANTNYAVGDKAKRTITENNETTVTGYICKTPNNDSTFDSSKWDIDLYMNYAEIIGNGSLSVPSNARTLDWDGNEELAGDLTLKKGTADEFSVSELKTEINSKTDELKSAVDNLDTTVLGVKNYVENKKIITSGTSKGELTSDSDFSVSEKIPISLFTSGTIITVDYGTVPANALFCVYDNQDAYLGSYSLDSANTKRTFTCNYDAEIASYFRFSFQKGYHARIANRLDTETKWETEITGGLGNDVDAIEADIANIPNVYMSTADTLDYSMVNRLDPDACEIGLVYPSGRIDDSKTSYFTTDYMSIHAGETLYFMTIVGAGTYAKRVAAYDQNKTVLPDEFISSDTGSFQQQNDVAYIRASFPYVSSDVYRTPQGKVCLPVSNPIYVPGYGQEPVIKPEYIRPFIRVYATDTESQIIEKFIRAYNCGNCDVWFDRASYTFGPELEKVSTDYGMTSNEIPIGNNCRYYFNGSTLTATVDLSQHPTAEGEDEFYCNFLGCQRRPSSYELHDGVLIATDTRYVVHDESSALSQTYRHLYQNMEMHYHTNLRQEAIRKCIGGGTGAHGVVEIVGCKFTTDGVDSCVSFHGNGTDVEGAEFDLNIRGCWFTGGIRAGALSANQTARLFYTGNSATAAPATYDRWTVTAFLNEVRS